jgi:hypothetical protein
MVDYTLIAAPRNNETSRVGPNRRKRLAGAGMLGRAELLESG